MSIFSRIQGFFSNSQPQAQPEQVSDNYEIRRRFEATEEAFDRLAGIQKDTSQEVTAETAVTITAFWRALNVIGGVVASLPFAVYRVTESTTVKQYSHPVSRLLRLGPNSVNTRFDFFQTMILHLHTFGNFFAKIDRNNLTGQASRLTIMEPQKVRMEYNNRNEVVYVYTSERGETRMLADRVVHISGMSWNALTGINLIEAFAKVFSTSLANQNYLDSFYKNGANLSGTISVPSALTEDAYKRLRASWQAQYGGVKNMGKTAILEQGAKYDQIGLSPSQAGADTTKKMTIADVARITGVPQFLLEDLDRATFNNIEHLSLLFVTYTILPLCQNIEAELTRKCLADGELDRFEIKADLHGLLRADTENRAKLIESLMKWGIINRDEARSLEGLNPIADGSGQAYYVPMNMIDPTQPIDNQNLAPNENG